MKHVGHDGTFHVCYESPDGIRRRDYPCKHDTPREAMDHDPAAVPMSREPLSVRAGAYDGPRLIEAAAPPSPETGTAPSSARPRSDEERAVVGALHLGL